MQSKDIDRLLTSHFNNQVGRFTKSFHKNMNHKPELVVYQNSKNRRVLSVDIEKKKHWQRRQAFWLGAASAIMLLCMYVGLELPTPSRIALTQGVEHHQVSETLSEFLIDMKEVARAFQESGEKL